MFCRYQLDGPRGTSRLKCLVFVDNFESVVVDMGRSKETILAREVPLGRLTYWQPEKSGFELDYSQPIS